MALPKDELELIPKKLTFEPDYTRFRSVCRSWRSAAPKRPQIPWLIATDPKIRTNFLYLYQFSFETNKFTLIPELSESPLLSSFTENSTVTIGASRGWLALFSCVTSSVSLFNPLTNSTIDLPNLKYWITNDFNSHHNFGLRCRFNLTSDPGESLSNCFALIYCSDWILYYKVGWTKLLHPEFHSMFHPKFHSLPHPEFDGNIHICCYLEKLFIASRGNVFVCDFGCWNPSVSKLVSVTPDDMSGFEFDSSYLVESDGDLFLVLVFFSDDISGIYNYFRVFKLEFGQRMVKLVELTSLGDKALVFSHETSFFLTASKYPGCKENYIYSSSIAYNFNEQRTVRKLIIYDFEGESNVLMDNDDDVTWNYSDWFAPSLLM